MLIKKITLVSALFLSLSGIASAAECVMHVTRTACPGQEKESFSKCKGSASCDEKQVAADAKECASQALAACKNTRLQITKYKKVTADFAGAAVENGKDFCVGHPDFPYASKADCK